MNIFKKFPHLLAKAKKKQNIEIQLKKTQKSNNLHTNG